MRKILVFSMAATVFAACGDLPTGPEAPAPSFSSHVWQAGNGSAYHGYTEPTFDADVNGNDVSLCAGWTDDYLYESGFHPTGVEPQHYSFDFEVWDDDAEAWVALGTVNGDVDGQNACLELEDLEDGTYVFRVKGIAHVGLGPSRTSHHTDWAEQEVVVGGGDVFHVRFVQSPGQSSISQHQDGWTESIDDLGRTAGTWPLQFVILKNLVPVTVCAPNGDFGAVSIDAYQAWSGGSTSATYAPNDCEDGKYQFTLSNDAPGAGANKLSSSGTLTVKLDGTTVENVVDFATEVAATQARGR